MTVPPTPRADIPADKLDAWTEAEKAAFLHLCAATGHTPGQNATLGDRSGFLNAFCFYDEAVETGGETFYAARPQSFVKPYTVNALFESRHKAQRFAMAVALSLPVTAVGNLDQLRLTNTGIGPVTEETVQIRGEAAARAVWRITLSLEMVIRIL